MSRAEYIELTRLCDQYQLEMQFFSALEEIELIHVVQVETTRCVPVEDIRQIERMVRLHKDLEINAAGIGAVVQLLDKIERMREEMFELRSRLRRYE